MDYDDDDVSTEASACTEVFDAHEFVLKDPTTGQYYRALRRLDRTKPLFPGASRKVAWDTVFRQEAVGNRSLIDAMMQNQFERPASQQSMSRDRWEGGGSCCAEAHWVRFPPSPMSQLMSHAFTKAAGRDLHQMRRSKDGKIIPPWNSAEQWPSTLI